MPNIIPSEIVEDISTVLNTVFTTTIPEIKESPSCPICHGAIVSETGRFSAYHQIIGAFDRGIMIGDRRHRDDYYRRFVACMRTERQLGTKPFPYFFVITTNDKQYGVQLVPEDVQEAILLLEKEAAKTEYVFSPSEIDIHNVVRRSEYNPKAQCANCGYTFKSSGSPNLETEGSHKILQIESHTPSIPDDVPVADADRWPITRYTVSCSDYGAKMFIYKLGTVYHHRSIAPNHLKKGHSEIKSETACTECNENFLFRGTPDHKLEKSWVLGKVPYRKILCTKTGKSFIYIAPSGKPVQVLSLTVNKLSRAGLGKTKIFWEIDSGESTKEDFTDYLDKSLMVGLELELDAKDSSNWEGGDFRQEVERIFKIPITHYHASARCKVCNNSECWEHLPENLVRNISEDSSIAGYEFIIYGANISSEEFAKRLPLEDMKRVFWPTTRDGLHLHLLLIDHQVVQLPTTIIKNYWQLFRFYYPAWIFLFGNTKPYFLRQNQFAPFSSFKESALRRDFTENIREIQGYTPDERHDHRKSGGLSFGNSRFSGNKISKFDLEIRTNDSTVDLEQIIAARALAKSMVLRAAQLSNFGIVKCTTDNKLWNKTVDLIEDLNRYRVSVGSEQEDFMRENAQRLLREVAPFLSEFERRCVQSLIKEPVRNREPTRLAKLETVLEKDSKLDIQIKKVIALGEETADSEDLWVEKVSLAIEKPRDEITLALRKVKAYYDRDLKTMLIKTL